MNDFDKKLSEALLRAGRLEGVESAYSDDDIAIRGIHVDDYLLVSYLGQLLDRGELEVKINPDRMEYLFKLLHM